MANRWALYDFDADAMATTRLYTSYDAAKTDADRLNDVLILDLGDIGPDNDLQDEESELEESAD